MIRKVREDGQTLCVLGMQHRLDPARGPVLGSMLKHGVEARIESLLSMPIAGANDEYFSTHTVPMGVGRGGGGQRQLVAYDATLIGGRRFEVVQIGSLSMPPEEPIFPARVRWLDEEPAACPAAIAMADTLGPLVKQWVGLVRTAGMEKHPGQLERIFADLGPIPAAEDASDRALWVAGLICPCPGLDIDPRLELMLEMRPATLSANSPLARVQAAHRGIVAAIDALERSQSQ